MKKRLFLVLLVVVMAMSFSFVVFANDNDYETDKIPVGSSTSQTTTTEYVVNKTTTTNTQNYTTTKKRPDAGPCDHIEASPVEENRVEPSCAKDGSHELVVYCEICNEEISRERKTIKALGHDFDVASFENGVANLSCKRAKCTEARAVEFLDYYNSKPVDDGKILDALKDDFINAKDYAKLLNDEKLKR